MFIQVVILAQLWVSGDESSEWRRVLWGDVEACFEDYIARVVSIVIAQILVSGQNKGATPCFCNNLCQRDGLTHPALVLFPASSRRFPLSFRPPPPALSALLSLLSPSARRDVRLFRRALARRPEYYLCALRLHCRARREVYQARPLGQQDSVRPQHPLPCRLHTRNK